MLFISNVVFLIGHIFLWKKRTLLRTHDLAVQKERILVTLLKRATMTTLHINIEMSISRSGIHTSRSYSGYKMLLSHQIFQLDEWLWNAYSFFCQYEINSWIGLYSTESHELATIHWEIIDTRAESIVRFWNQHLVHLLWINRSFYFNEWFI